MFTLVHALVSRKVTLCCFASCSTQTDIYMQWVYIALTYLDTDLLSSACCDLPLVLQVNLVPYQQQLYIFDCIL